MQFSLSIPKNGGLDIHVSAMAYLCDTNSYAMFSHIISFN